ncbi:MAG TPA: rhodanese-like domain-containing protein [Nitrososphaera sp.]
MPDIRRAIERAEQTVLVDVRSPKEFSGEITAPPEYPTEYAQRGGHIPGAKNITWAQAVREIDGTFRSREELEALYEGKGVTSDKHVICYCRIGERSSHSSFVLKYLLGYPSVSNYDGSDRMGQQHDRKSDTEISPSLPCVLDATARKPDQKGPFLLHL